MADLPGAHIHEYLCGKCGTTFTGDGEATEEHYSNEFGDWGQPCGGIGTLERTYFTQLRLED